MPIARSVEEEEFEGLRVSRLCPSRANVWFFAAVNIRVSGIQWTYCHVPDTLPMSNEKENTPQRHRQTLLF